jgi:hypothetical protein
MVLFALAMFVAGGAFGQQDPDTSDSVLLIDDFQQDSDGSLPSKWRMRRDKSLVPLTESYMHDDEKFTVVREGSNLFVRAYSRDEAAHIYMGNEEGGFDWDIRTHPVLEWDWRANKLPANASEDVEQLNDSGGGLYVIFDIEGFLIKRPRTIKYVYSSSLPVGSVVKHGKLAVIVASSAIDGIGNWVHVSRNVAEDYRNVFGGEPDRRPLSLRLWSDSDNIGTEAEVDFDNLKLLKAE